MSSWFTKIVLHPFFRFFFWLVCSVFIIVTAISETMWTRWILFTLAFFFLLKTIDKLLESINYIRNDHTT